MTRSPTRRPRRLSRALLGRLVGVGLLAVLLASLDVGRLGRALAGAAAWPLAAAALLNLPILALKAERWGLLLAAQGLGLGRRRTQLAFFAAQYLGLVTPGRIGDLTKALYVQEAHGVGLASAAPSVIADRLFDLGALLAVGAAAAAAYDLPGAAPALVTLALLAAAPALLVVPAVARRLAPRGAAERAETGAAEHRATGAAEHRATGAAELWAGCRRLVDWRLVPAAALTAACYAATFAQTLLLARALGLPLGYRDCALLGGAANLVALLPVSLGGLGTREAAMAYLVGRVGLAPEAGVALALTIFAFGFVVAGLLGLVAYQLAPPPLSQRTPP